MSIDVINRIKDGNNVLAGLSFADIAADAVRISDLNGGSIAPKTLLEEYVSSREVSGPAEIKIAHDQYQKYRYDNNLSESQALDAILNRVLEVTGSVIDQAKEIGSHLGKALAANPELENLSGFKAKIDNEKPTGRGGR
jgi:hypothetical protein